MKGEKTRRLTPIMGWASWNCFRTNISETLLREQAKALVDTGLSECGYKYLNMDDGFQGGRDSNGRIRFHKERFPNGIKIIADYAHSLGLCAGIYADAGDNTCGYYYDQEGCNGEGVGLYGHEAQDLFIYLEDCGFDFIKVDWCGGVRLGLNEEEQYTRIGNIIEEIRQRTGKHIVYNICRWQFPGAWAVNVADSWRTAADIHPSFSSIMHQIDNIKPLRKYSGPGHVNDLDMMQLGNGMSYTEEKTHFSMWCMMSTPLVIGCDLTKVQKSTLEILKNKEMIAVNQDEACLQAFVTKEIRASNNNSLLAEVWVKDLGCTLSKRKAVAFLNRSGEELVISISARDIGLEGKFVNIRDVWRHRTLNENVGQSMFSVNVESHGVEVFVIEGENAMAVNDIFEMSDVPEVGMYVEEITDIKLEALKAEGAVLVDVRTEDEYKYSCEDGAINLPYMDIHGTANSVLTNKNTPIIVYCSTGKRSMQAGQSLKYLGYKNVYRWKRKG